MIQIGTGDLDFLIDEKVTKKLCQVKEDLEREMDEISHMNNWAPSKYNTRDQFMRAAKQILVSPESMKIAFLSKLDSFRQGKVHWIELEKTIAGLVHTKKWGHKTENEKKNNLAMIEVHQNHKSDYFRWRAKRDYKIEQANRYNEFVQRMDENQYFMYSRMVGDFSEKLVHSLKYLRFINLESNIKLSKLRVTLRDSCEDVISQTN